MLKGVNKQILEVTNTESPYFEKIILNCDNSNPVDYLDTLTESNINGAKEKIYMLNKIRSD